MTALRIPRDAWLDFLRRWGLFESLQQSRANREFLQSTWLFSELASFPLQNRIAGLMERRVVKEDAVMRPEGRAEILLLADGLVTVFLGSIPIRERHTRGFLREESVLRGTRDLPPGWEARFTHGSQRHNIFEARALLESTLYAIPGDALEDIPIVQWKLMETYERRLKNFRAEVRFEWNDSYGVGIPALDGQHKEMFEIIDGISAMAEGRQPGDGAEAMVESISLAKSHLKRPDPAQPLPAVRFEAVVRGNGSSAGWTECASTWKKARVRPPFDDRVPQGLGHRSLSSWRPVESGSPWHRSPQGTSLLPHQVVRIPLTQLANSVRLLDTYAGLIQSYVVVNTPMATLLPKSMLEAVCRLWRVFEGPRSRSGRCRWRDTARSSRDMSTKIVLDRRRKRHVRPWLSRQHPPKQSAGGVHGRSP